MAVVINARGTSVSNFRIGKGGLTVKTEDSKLKVIDTDEISAGELSTGLLTLEAGTGFNQTITVNGDETNIDIVIDPKGTGVFRAPSGYDMSSAVDSAFATKEYVDTQGGGINNVVEDTTPQLGGALDAQNFTINNLADPTTDDQAATKAYVDANIGGGGLTDVVDDLTPQLGGALDAQNFTINNLADPTTGNQAATKSYVDDEITSATSNFITEVSEDTTPVLGGNLAGGSFDITGVGQMTASNVTSTGQLTVQSGGADITGNINTSGHFIAENTSPFLQLNETDATVNSGQWRIQATGEALLIRPIADNNTPSGTNEIEITRTGTDIDALILQDSVDLEVGGNLTVSGTLAANLNAGSNTITNLTDPTSAQEAATKAYVDSLVNGLTIKEPVRAATTANITRSNLQTIDGVALNAGDRVLVKDQSSASENGLFTVVDGGNWTRTTDADNSPGNEVFGGIAVYVEEGTENGEFRFVLTSPTGSVTLDSDSLVFTKDSVASSISAVVDDTTPQLGGDLDAQNFTINNLTDPTTDDQAATKSYVDDEITSATGSFITEVSEDTTPQLGGNLDVNGFAIRDDSDDSLTFGNSTQRAFIDYSTGGQIAISCTGSGSPDIDILLSPANNGVVSIASDLNMNSNTINSLADPTSAQDAATKAYVDANSINNVVEDTTPQLGGNLDAGGFVINNLADPTTNGQAATKDYVDDNFVNINSASLNETLTIEGTSKAILLLRDNNGTPNDNVWSLAVDADQLLFEKRDNSNIVSSVILSIDATGALRVDQALNYETLVTTDDTIPNKKYVDDEITSATGSFITEVSEDTTPQLGGNLDGQNFNISGVGSLTADDLTINSGGADITGDVNVTDGNIIMERTGVEALVNIRSDISAINGSVGRVAFVGHDALGNNHQYAAISAHVEDNTNTAEDGYLVLRTSDGGQAATERFRVGSSLITSSVALDMGSNTINNLADPVSDNQAATKDYVDNQQTLDFVSNSGTINMTANDDVALCSTGAGTVTVNLVAAATKSGQVVIVKDSGGNASTNNITVDPNGSETIDGQTTLVINADWESVSLFSNGTVWFII